MTFDSTWTGNTFSGTPTWYAVPTSQPLTFRFVGTETTKRRNRWRLTALVACGHAAFFLALALIGWLR